MNIKVTNLAIENSNPNTLEFTEMKNVKGGQEVPLPQPENLDLPDGFSDSDFGNLLKINPGVEFDPAIFENFGSYSFAGFTSLPSF